MKNNTKKTLQIYLQHCLKYKVSSLLVIFSVMAAASINAIFPLYLKKFFDALTSGGNTGQIANQLIKVLIMLAVLDMLNWLAWRVTNFGMTYLQPRVIADLSNTCFAYLHKHSYNFFENNFVGSLTKRVKWFSNAFEVIHDKLIWSLLPLTVTVTIIISVLFKRSFWLGMVVLIWLVLFLSLNWFFSRYKIKYDIKRAAKETEVTGLLADTVANAHTIQLFNGYHREVKRFAKVTDELRQIRKFTWDLTAIFEAGQGLLVIALEIGGFYLAIRLWQKGILTVGDFVLLQVYLIAIFDRVWDFGKVIRSIYENLADAEEMTVILQTPHEITDIVNAKNLQITSGQIDFKAVDFYYHQTRSVLKDFNLAVASHEKIALIGPSGAGKTTIVRLLLRIHELTAGEILIDGQNITHIKQESLRASIGLVPQDPILFHRSLMENIRYGRPDATNQEVIEAAKKARCDEFINELPEKYNTFVGERGIKLSGGERQRVAIARAILKNAPILVLDEATSSLDSASEKMIQEAIDELMKNKTVIVVAHRLSTIRKMDRIVVIDDGKIKEQGTHEQLLGSGGDGLYKKLWQLQAGGFIR
ncbi:MAG: ABC transporter ATP-binding protein [Candidatus Gribaldobacteria bacterium]|nr:ABC transporter ATP-binding protein [Candidatus Gribaldobacteria bacterium]